MSLQTLHLIARIIFLVAIGLQLLAPRDVFRVTAGVTALLLALLAFLGQ